MPLKDAELLAEYQAVMVDICRSLGAEPRVDISDPTYYQELIDNAVAGLREPSLKNAVVLKQAGDDALLFTGNNVEPFVVAFGYNPERKDWSAGTYYADLRQAVCEFDKQFGTLGYSYNLSLDDLYPLLEEKGYEPTHENVRALMLNTNDFEDVSEYINESLTRLFDDEIDSCEEILERSAAKTMPEKSFHVRSAEEIAGVIAMDSAKEQQAYLNICEENGWSYSIDEKWNEVELSKSSPAGEDFSFIVSLEDLPDEVHSFIFNFDVDEHVDMWIEARRAGVEGVPTTQELVDDAEAIEQMLEELSRALLDHKKGMVVDGLKVFNKTLEERGSKAIFVDLPTKDTVWGVIELEVILNVGSKKHKEYIQAFYDYYARGTEEGCFEPFQADFDKACEEFRTLHADDPRYNNATIDANDWMDPIEADERIFDLDAEALRVVRDVNEGFSPFVDDEKRRYHLISQAEVDAIVEKHQNGLKDLPAAQVANFSADDLSFFYLSNLDLGTVDTVGKEVCDPVSFEGANLAFTDLSYTELKGADFRSTLAYGTVCREANLEGCDFSGAILVGVDFTNALMKDTIFDETIIKDVILPNGQKLTIDDPADSLAVMERLTKPKQEKPTRASSLDELASRAQEKAHERNSQLQDDRMPNAQKRGR